MEKEKLKHPFNEAKKCFESILDFFYKIQTHFKN